MVSRGRDMRRFVAISVLGVIMRIATVVVAVALLSTPGVVDRVDRGFIVRGPS